MNVRMVSLPPFVETTLFLPVGISSAAWTVKCEKRQDLELRQSVTFFQFLTSAAADRIPSKSPRGSKLESHAIAFGICARASCDFCVPSRIWRKLGCTDANLQPRYCADLL
jgi:hypothetical protein